MENISPDDKTKIIQLIQTNLTPLDNFINFDYEYYDIKKYKGLIVPTIEAVNNANANFTEPFLRYIDEIVKDLPIGKWTNTIAYIISGLFVPFNIPSTYRTEPFPTIDKPYPYAYYYSPVNRLYFLFLVNLYCNYQNYVKDYTWLDTHFLFLCDQIGLTGVFAIKQKLYNELCGDCAETSRGVGEVNDGYFLLSNSSIKIKLENFPPDEEKKIRENMSKFIASSKKERKVFKLGKTQKTLAVPPAGKSRKSKKILTSAAVAAAAASVAPASVAPAATKTKTRCTHGAACYRTHNLEHTSKFSHPMDEDESTVDVDYSTAGGAKRKTHKKKKTHKMNKTHKKKKTHKRKKHSKRK
jgi:hypothetical protein